jgi:aspartate-semialdehyde dehydrogenase
MSKKLPVAVVGATGLAGQQFLAALGDHPWFEVVRIAASERSAGKKYVDAIRDAGQSRWFATDNLPAAFEKLTVENAAAMKTDGLAAIFTAVESDAARELEPQYAKDVPVFSTASAFRYEADVPILLPAVNGEHTKLLDAQKKNRGWKGYVVPVPNCTTTGMVHTLKPVHEAFGLTHVTMTSMQAVSGAGRSPGVLALDITDNVIPFIAKEEEKVEKETRKILGAVKDGAIAPLDLKVSCTCTRVPVLEGHTEAVFVGLREKAGVEDVKRVMREWGAHMREARLPSAPEHWLTVHEDPFRPQPRRDRDAEGGMTTSVGRLREDAVLPNGVKWVLVSHNTKMGAAKGAILAAEWCKTKGQLG